MRNFPSRLALAVALAATPLPAFAQDGGNTDEEIAALKSELAALSARLAELEAEREAERPAFVATPAVPPAVPVPPAAAPQPREGIAFQGAPEISNESGWSFKPRGRLMIDAGLIDSPDAAGRDDGFASELRRARLGVSGDMPGGFGYKFELDFAGDEVAVTDAILTYDAGDAATLTVGQHNNFQSLEELTSSLFTSFIERAAFTDAFGFERRVGLSGQLSAGDLTLWAGVFGDNSADLPSGNRSLDARAVFAPSFSGGQLHLGGSVHWNRQEDGVGDLRYRQRPHVHFTSDRYVDTRAFPASEEMGTGIEAAYIAGPFHAAAEGFWQTAYRPGFDDPTFFGGYVEAGVFVTPGDTRGYKGGKFDRVKPVRGFDKGGIGAVQLNARYDRLDLGDAGIFGGVQDSFGLSAIWTPTAYTRFMVDLTRLQYSDAAISAAGDVDYGVNTIGARAQVDF